MLKRKVIPLLEMSPLVQLSFLDAFYRPTHSDLGTPFQPQDHITMLQGYDAGLVCMDVALRLRKDPAVRMTRVGNPPKDTIKRPWLDAVEGKDGHGNPVTGLRLTNEGKRQRYRLLDLMITRTPEARSVKVDLMDPAKEEFE